MWQDKLNEIVEEEKMFGAELNEGASEEEIEQFQKLVTEALNFTFPNEYINFLKTINGLEFNGYSIYGIDQEYLEKKPKRKVDGLIDANNAWHSVEHQKQYLFFADGGLSWYVYDRENKRYKLIAKPEGDELEEFETFDEMLERIMSDALL